MLVATFGPNTAWEGREIIWDVDHFILVGHGAIPAAGVLDYDRRGQLVWADPRYRSWAAEIDRWETGGAGSWLLGRGRRGARTAASAPPLRRRPAPALRAGRRRVPTWVIVVIVSSPCCSSRVVVAATSCRRSCAPASP